MSDGKGTPALVFAGVGVMILTGGKGKLAFVPAAPAPAAEKKED